MIEYRVPFWKNCLIARLWTRLKYCWMVFRNGYPYVELPPGVSLKNVIAHGVMFVAHGDNLITDNVFDGRIKNGPKEQILVEVL